MNGWFIKANLKISQIRAPPGHRPDRKELYHAGNRLPNVLRVLNRTRKESFAYLAINVTSLSTANTVLAGLAGSKNNGAIQVSTFGNVHGVYKPGHVKLKPSILKSRQNAVVKAYGERARLYLIFHGEEGAGRLFFVRRIMVLKRGKSLMV